MGALVSFQGEDVAGESSEVSDDEYASTYSDMDDNLTADAVESPVTKQHFKTTAQELYCITKNQVEAIDDDLDTYEKVSLIYLLYDNAHVALQYVVLLLQNADYKILTEWMEHVLAEGDKWQSKLLEALTIIQNYQVLKKLGFPKTAMYARFLPLSKENALFVNPVRKCLYRICEDFTRQDTFKFISYMQNETKTMPNYNINNGDVYLELYLLYFEMEKFIFFTDKDEINIDPIIKICKYMELDDCQNTLVKLSSKNVHENKRYERVQFPGDVQSNTGKDVANESDGEEMFDPEFLNIDKTPSNLSKGKFENENKSKKRNKPQKHEVPLTYSKVQDRLGDNRYDMDPENPGILLIINNERFYTEYREELQHLLTSDKQLELRDGTDIDRDTLKVTFEKFGFRVYCANDLTHENIIFEIKKTVEKVGNASALFIAILSHGDQGVVYGSNSIDVKVKLIQDIMCKDTKPGKPKVLILQSCQGSECQELNKTDDLTIDGFSSNVLPVPTTADMLVFWATVPGYGAVRHKKTGSWFIQTLCEKIIERPNNHFSDICVFVQQEVVNKRWNQKSTGKQGVMVPLVETTLSKFLYFPKLK